MSTQAFSIYDFFVDVLPGALTLLLVVSLLPEGYTAMENVTKMGVFEGTLFLLVSYLLGHIVQSISSPVDSWWMVQEFEFGKLTKENRLYPFENLLNDARQNDDYVVATQFLNHKGDFFEDDISGAELFSVTQSYLWNHNIGRMRRFQILYTLFRSLWVLFLISTLLYLIAILAEGLGWYQTIWSFKELLFITLSLGVSTAIAYLRRVKFHNEMAKAMLFDFYANVLSESD